MELTVFQIQQLNYGICYQEKYKVVLSSPFPKIKLENRLLKNVHASFVSQIQKMLAIFDFSHTSGRLAVVF